jgi:hypothetical protein
MRAQANFVDLARALIVEVGFHHVLRKNMSIEKELMIGFRRVERFFERSGADGTLAISSGGKS